MKQQDLPGEVGSTRFKPPTLLMLAEEGVKIGLPMTECEKFYFFHDSKGWKIGKVPMKSWKSAMQTWLIRWKESHPSDKPKTVFEIKTIIDACQLTILELKNRHATEGPLGIKFDSDMHREMYNSLNKKVRELRLKLINM